MNDKILMSNQYGYYGVYRAKLLVITNESDIRAYIPGVNSINPFDSNGNIDTVVYEKNKLSYPIVQWCCYNLESKNLIDIKGPVWVMFENGDIQYPVCISYAVIGGGGESSDNGGTSSGSGINGEFTTVAGEGVILIQGPVNDSRNTKYSDISQVPQTIVQEWSISKCISEVERYANKSDVESNSKIPVAKAIVKAGGATIAYSSALGIDVAVIGNAILCATTNKFGKDGDYLWAHFTDGTECLFVRFDEKSTSAVYGPADPANEWGHWVDYEKGFENATTISILEICGMNQSGLKKTCDYIVNLGSFVNNSDLAFKSLSDVKSLVESKISKVNTSGSTGAGKNKSKSDKIKDLFGTTSLPTSESVCKSYQVNIKVDIINEQGVRTNMNLTVHKGVADDVKKIFKEIADIGFICIASQCGGYNYRKVTGGSSLSQHSYGTAIDINWDYNPYSKNSNYKCPESKYKITPNVVNIFANYGWSWGGNWTTPKDYMHFTYLGG